MSRAGRKRNEGVELAGFPLPVAAPRRSVAGLRIHRGRFARWQTESRPMITHQVYKKKIVIVEDHPLLLQEWTEFFELEHWAVFPFQRAYEAIGELGTISPDVVFTDLRMEKVDGRDVAAAAAALRPKPIVVIVTGDIEISRGLLADVVFAKPVDPAEVLKWLQLLSARRVDAN